MQMFPKIEIATLMKDVNKYYPGTAPFELSSLFLSEDIKMPVQRTNSANKNNTFNTSNINITSTIDLEIPKHVTLDYKDKIVKKGTKFIALFYGDDSRKPIIVARIES